MRPKKFFIFIYKNFFCKGFKGTRFLIKGFLIKRVYQDIPCKYGSPKPPCYVLPRCVLPCATLCPLIVIAIFRYDCTTLSVCYPVCYLTYLKKILNTIFHCVLLLSQYPRSFGQLVQRRQQPHKDRLVRLKSHKSVKKVWREFRAKKIPLTLFCRKNLHPPYPLKLSSPTVFFS